MKASAVSSSMTSLLFMSPPTIVSPSCPPIVMKTTTRWPICLPSHECYYTSSSNYPLPSLFVRCADTATDWSSVRVSEHIDTIVDEHKQMLHAYRTEHVLKQSIDALSSQSTFKDGWSLLSRRFSNLMEFCGVIATLFPGTSTVESDFSICVGRRMHFAKACRTLG
jgi:hypothetical protein